MLDQELLLPLVTDTDISMEISGFAALALGLVFTSTCKEVSRGPLARDICRDVREIQ